MATDIQLDRIYDEVDNFLINREFELCDNLLRTLDMSILDTDQILGYLTVTLDAKSKLPFRKVFYSLAKEEIKRRGEDEKNLFSGLR